MADHLRDELNQGQKQTPDPKTGTQPKPERFRLAGLISWFIPSLRRIFAGSVLLAIYFYIGPLFLPLNYQGLVLMEKATKIAEAEGIKEVTPAQAAQAAAVEEAKASAVMPVTVAIRASEAEIEVKKSAQLNELQAQLHAITSDLDVRRSAHTQAISLYQDCTAEAEKTAAAKLGAITDTSRPWERIYNADLARESALSGCAALKDAADRAQASIWDTEFTLSQFKSRHPFITSP